METQSENWDEVEVVPAGGLRTTKIRGLLNG